MKLRHTACALLGLVVLLVTACGSDGSEPKGETTAQPPAIPSRLEGFGIEVIDVAGLPWLVAVADTPGLRSQGLMGVADLGSLDGMLFVFEDDTTARFHMLDTVIALDIGFFTVAGDLVSINQMVPCAEEPCPSYSADGPYRYALEAPEGALIDLPLDGVLDLGSR